MEVSQKEFASNAKSDIATRDQLASQFGCRSTGPVIGSKRLLCVELFVEAVGMPLGSHNRSSAVRFLEKTRSMYPPEGFTRVVTPARNSRSELL